MMIREQARASRIHGHLRAPPGTRVALRQSGRSRTERSQGLARGRRILGAALATALLFSFDLRLHRCFVGVKAIRLGLRDSPALITIIAQRPLHESFARIRHRSGSRYPIIACVIISRNLVQFPLFPVVVPCTIMIPAEEVRLLSLSSP